MIRGASPFLDTGAREAARFRRRCTLSSQFAGRLPCLVLRTLSTDDDRIASVTGARVPRQPEPPIYTFLIRLKGDPDASPVWREVEVAANQTLPDLGEAIARAFDFTDPHLWSSFLSGKAWDAATEYACQGRADPFVGPRAVAAGRVRIDQVPFPGKSGQKEFLFLFDYDDAWHFGVKLVCTSDAVTPGATYPRSVANAGAAPLQYLDVGDDWDDEDADVGGEDA